MEKVILKIFQKIKKEPYNPTLYNDAFECIKIIFQTDKKRAFEFNGAFRKYINYAMKRTRDKNLLSQLEELGKESFHLEAQDIFDSYLIYLEWERPAKKKFYLPRRAVLKTLVDDLQDLADRKIKFLGISLPPRVGKSTLCIMFMTWMMGKHPETANVMSGHSDKLTDGFYREILSIITDDVTYNWAKVFPEAKIVATSAKNETIDLVNVKRFPSLTCRSIVGTLTGAVEIGEDGVLYSDDLIEDLEESLNPDRLEAKYNAYLNQLKDRKKDGALELMVGTRWNVFDPLGRIADEYADDPAYRFRVIPALNENDESNFDYNYGVGFSTAYYHDMRKSIDDATWWAKYMGQPYVREGLVFPQGELNYYNGVLPGGEADRVMATVDVAWGGGDYLSMPICYMYDGVGYIDDVVYNKGDKTVTQPLVAGKIEQHRPHQNQFEANNGGAEYCEDVSQILDKDDVHVNLSYRKSPPTSSKLSRIIQYAPEIKKLYFRDNEHSSPEYKAFMRNLTTFAVTGKNKNDDAPDSLAMLIELKDRTYGAVHVFQRPC